MDGPSTSNDDGDDPGDRAAGPRDPADDGMPRWVRAFVIAGIIVTAVIVLVVLLGGGDHGPGRHLPGSGDVPPAGDALPAGDLLPAGDALPVALHDG